MKAVYLNKRQKIRVFVSNSGTQILEYCGKLLAARVKYIDGHTRYVKTNIVYSFTFLVMNMCTHFSIIDSIENLNLNNFGESYHAHYLFTK